MDKTNDSVALDSSITLIFENTEIGILFLKSLYYLMILSSISQEGLKEACGELAEISQFHKEKREFLLNFSTQNSETRLQKAKVVSKIVKEPFVLDVD